MTENSVQPFSAFKDCRALKRAKRKIKETFSNVCGNLPDVFDKQGLSSEMGNSYQLL